MLVYWFYEILNRLHSEKFFAFHAEVYYNLQKVELKKEKRFVKLRWGILFFFFSTFKITSSNCVNIFYSGIFFKLSTNIKVVLHPLANVNIKFPGKTMQHGLKSKMTIQNCLVGIWWGKYRSVQKRRGGGWNGPVGPKVDQKKSYKKLPNVAAKHFFTNFVSNLQNTI